MGWGMAQATYGTEEHVRLMREGWEPMSVVMVPQSNAISREVTILFIVFLKRKVDENVVEGQGIGIGNGCVQG